MNCEVCVIYNNDRIFFSKSLIKLIQFYNVYHEYILKYFDYVNKYGKKWPCVNKHKKCVYAIDTFEKISRL